MIPTRTVNVVEEKSIFVERQKYDRLGKMRFLSDISTKTFRLLISVIVFTKCQFTSFNLRSGSLLSTTPKEWMEMNWKTEHLNPSAVFVEIEFCAPSARTALR